MTSQPDWAVKEPDEPAEDWLLRLHISKLAAAGLIRLGPDRKDTAS